MIVACARNCRSLNESIRRAFGSYSAPNSSRGRRSISIAPSSHPSRQLRQSARRSTRGARGARSTRRWFVVFAYAKRLSAASGHGDRHDAERALRSSPTVRCINPRRPCCIGHRPPTGRWARHRPRCRDARPRVSALGCTSASFSRRAERRRHRRDFREGTILVAWARSSHHAVVAFGRRVGMR